jgi:hypothetical protein
MLYDLTIGSYLGRYATLVASQHVYVYQPPYIINASSLHYWCEHY